MNTSKQDPNKNDVMDEVDDLTRFLDEDFDTDDVDLFEFTSEEESPLTQLKSIILSTQDANTVFVIGSLGLFFSA